MGGGEMYGTVARMKVKPGKLDEFREFAWEMAEQEMAGHIGTNLHVSESEPGVVYMSVVFKDREAYRANADSPEMQSNYERYMSYLEGEPEWNDGEVTPMRAGLRTRTG
jgi:quinol monooxygenase YgiN